MTNLTDHSGHAMRTPLSRSSFSTFVLAAATLAACEVVSREQVAKQDTTTVAPPAAVAASAGDSARVASGVAGGVPAVPRDSASGAVAADAPPSIGLEPSQPRRGGVVVATAQIVDATPPKCTWRGAPLPCYRDGTVAGATIPLPASEPAGTFSFVIARGERVPGSRGEIARQVDVGDVDFGREIIFLTPDLYALVKKKTDIARDGRAFHQVVAGETDQRYWKGAWRAPVPGKMSAGYGVERFYYPASDSSRVLSVGRDMSTRGSFGADTSSATAAGDVPGWRHAGVDIAVPRGTPIIAPAGGLVADVGEYTLTGRTVAIDHGQGVYSAYFHLDTIFVKKGDIVRQGRTLGKVGVSGLSTGPHLHFGIYIHGRDVNPAAWYALPTTVAGVSRDIADPLRTRSR
ncbi:MAG: hypothetical protein NVS4B3_07790 [Gemmatimonadaceae bacterium]